MEGYTGRGVKTGGIIGAALLALLLAGPTGCSVGGITVKNPFASHKPSPLEVALASTEAAINGATEWYVDACARPVPGIAVSTETCATYRNHVDPALRAAHNSAISVAQGVANDTTATASIVEARRLFRDFTGRYGVSGETWARAVAAALGLLQQRIGGI